MNFFVLKRKFFIKEEYDVTKSYSFLYNLLFSGGKKPLIGAGVGKHHTF